MTDGPGRRDLYVLVADQDMRETMLKLLGRSKSLGIRPVTYTVERHLNRDPGCRTDALRYLHPRASNYRRALIVFDKEGCGREGATREEIQREVEQDLSCAGWRQRSKVIVIDPELEAWVWAGSSRIPEILGWATSYRLLKASLSEKGFWPREAAKPPNPKEAMKAALREKGRRASSRLFGALAESVTLRGCQCPAFNELKRTLRSWFPAETS